MKKQITLHRKKDGFKNNLYSGELVYTGDHKTDTRLCLIRYDASQVKEHILPNLDALMSSLQEGYIHWLKINGLSNVALIAEIGRQTKLHYMDVQDILTPQHIAKVQIYGDKTMVLMNSFYYSDSGSLEQESVCLLLGKNYVITFQESDQPLFANVTQALEANTGKIRTRPADYLFCLLLNEIFVGYIDVIGRLDEELETMEDELLDENIPDDLSFRIQEHRRYYLRLKKALLPINDDFKNLVHNENKMIEEDNKVYIDDLQDRLSFIIQSVDTCRETIASLMDLYMSTNSLKMNDIMKRLTVVATIFIPLTFVVGVWGMNFKYMPELQWRYGYLIAWGIMILTGLIVWLFIKKRKWN